jgi:hypothetical protein
VAIPEDLDDPGVPKRTGVITLPVNVRWSGPERAFNLGDPRDRLYVYEQVLREGGEEDVRHIIDLDTLIELWDQLVLPVYVRRRWADWIREHRGLTLAG